MTKSKIVWVNANDNPDLQTPTRNLRDAKVKALRGECTRTRSATMISGAREHRSNHSVETGDVSLSQ